MDGMPPELQLLFDKKSSVMAAITVTPHENANANLDVMLKVMNGTIPANKAVNVNVAGVYLPPNCAAAVKIFKSEYGILKNFKPIVCPKA